MAKSEATLGACCLAELLGTYLLVFFGCGAVHAAVLTGAQSGLWQVAIVWAIAIMVAVYIFGGISGAHINPAITLAAAAWGGFPFRRVAPYIVSQVAGAFLAAATLFFLYAPQLAAHERDKDIRVERGQPGSEATAMCYGEYFPAPSKGNLLTYKFADSEGLEKLVAPETALLAEFLGTLILALAVFAFTDPDNRAAPPPALAPVFIGLTVAILISVIAPLTQACFNPARDFGPRLFASLAGWGNVAIPGPNGIHFLTVYILAPSAGAVAGGGLYHLILKPAAPASERTS